MDETKYYERTRFSADVLKKAYEVLKRQAGSSWEKPNTNGI